MALNLFYCLGSFFQLPSALAINDQDQLLRLWGEVYYLHTHLSTDGRAGFSGLACSLYICINFQGWFIGEIFKSRWIYWYFSLLSLHTLYFWLFQSRWTDFRFAWIFRQLEAKYFDLKGEKLKVAQKLLFHQKHSKNALIIRKLQFLFSFIKKTLDICI